MGDVGVSEDEIDWELVLGKMPEMTELFDVDPSLLTDSSSVDAFSNPSPDSVPPWIGEIEHLLMKDDEAADDKVAAELNHEFCNDFLSDILIDFPADQSGRLDASDDKNSNSNVSDGNGSPEEENIDVAEVNDKGEDDDPISKKRKRQLRNRDAAVRSRERKKTHMRDLELKSRYLEGECRRLGRLLQCCFAENQALRFSLQTGKQAFGASMTKQESAVLLLESLLLGSLLWFLGTMCLFTLPRRLLQLTLEAVPLESVENKGLERVTPRGAGSKIFGFRIVQSFVKSKRCKASRTKMKPSLFSDGVFV